MTPKDIPDPPYKLELEPIEGEAPKASESSSARARFQVDSRAPVADRRSGTDRRKTLRFEPDRRSGVDRRPRRGWEPGKNL